jgi:hypothetical protein
VGAVPHARLAQWGSRNGKVDGTRCAIGDLIVSYIPMKIAASLIVCALVLSGCQTRSISDSDYRDPYGWRRPDSDAYKGELNEMDILGVAPVGDATQENIAKRLETAAVPRLRRGDRIILIQSGAGMPDGAMMQEVMPVFDAAPFSGVPPENKARLPESLRLRAAQGGYRYIVCYWGVLESAQTDKEGKIVSWVPIMGSFVLDQKQQMRIRLKALLVDVATGNWKMVTPEAHTDASYNSRWTRESADQKLVNELKAKGYKTLVADLLKS